MINRILLINFLFLICFSCSNPFGVTEKNSGINIYFLQDENLTLTTAKERPLSQLILQDKAWISSDDIERYDWSAHLIYFKRDMVLSDKDVSTFGKPFIVTAGGVKCYLGALWALYSSIMPDAPVILATPSLYSDDIVCISLELLKKQDPRNDLRVKEALIKKGQFHAGLQCTLDRVEVITKNDSSSVKYTYTLHNLDVDGLYVLDPDLMGSGLFHYFTNGVYLNNIVHHYWAENREVEKPEPWNHWEKSWHSRIESGKSITRTVLLEGYPRIVPGEYQCTFQFPSPSNIEKDRRKLYDGRIWMGRINSSVLVTRLTE